MSAEAAMLVRSWKVGKHTATLMIGRPTAGKVQHCLIEWSGEVPGSLSRREWKQYRDGRNKAIAELSAELGLTVALVEV